MSQVQSPRHTWPSECEPTDALSSRMRLRRVTRLPDSIASGTERAYADTFAASRGCGEASASSMASHHADSHLASASLGLPARIHAWTAQRTALWQQMYVHSMMDET